LNSNVRLKTDTTGVNSLGTGGHVLSKVWAGRDAKYFVKFVLSKNGMMIWNFPFCTFQQASIAKEAVISLNMAKILNLNAPN